MRRTSIPPPLPAYAKAVQVRFRSSAADPAGPRTGRLGAAGCQNRSGIGGGSRGSAHADVLSRSRGHIGNCDRKPAGKVYLREQGPDLIRAGRAGLNWKFEPGVTERAPDGMFLAACLWQEKNRGAPIPLPFWSAPDQHHNRLGRKIGVPWTVAYLKCVAAAAMVGLRELKRLQEAETKGRMMGITARSRLPQAVDAVLRTHI